MRDDRTDATRRRVSPGSVVEISSIGDDLIAEAIADTPLSAWPLIPVEDVFLIAAMDELLSPAAAFAIASSYLVHLVESGDYAEATVEKAAALIGRFVKYTEVRYHINDVRAVEQSHVLAFVHAPVLGDELRAAAGRTIDNRRWAVDLYFRTLRGLNLYEGDPLLDAARAARPSTDFRPLVDTEIQRCRKHAPTSLDDTLNPVREALAEAMAATSEIAGVVIADYDKAARRIWLHGSQKRLHGRWSQLLPAQVEVIERRIRDLAARDPLTRLAYDGTNSDRAEAAICISLRKMLNRAGLTREIDPRVRPSSIRAWGGRHLYDEVRNIEEVARRLGLRKLNDARTQIGIGEPEPEEPPPHRGQRS